MRRLTWVLGLGSALAGCRGISLEQFDQLHDQLEARTVLREPRFTLWSPLDAATSSAWAAVVERQALAVDAAFGFDPEDYERLQVVLERVQVPAYELPGPGESVTVSVYPRASRNGVGGHASGSTVTIFVAPPTRFVLQDGTVVLDEADPEDFVSLLNHELTHVAVRRSGIEPTTWLSEGASDVVEALELGPAGLLDVGAPGEVLERALALEPDEWSLERLLAWRENGARVESGQEAVDHPRRALCGLYVRWLLGLQGDGQPVTDLATRLRALAERRASELAADEPAWLAWREALLGAREPAGD